MNTRELLVWDTETTGLTLHPDAPNDKQPQIIEWAAIVLSLDSGDILREHSLLINPGIPLPEEIIKITGITDDALKAAPPFAARLAEIRAAFASAESHVAHNLPFDRAVLTAELARRPNDLFAQSFAWPGKAFCTMNLYTPHWGRPPRLIELYAAVMGKPYEQTHRGLDDVRAMVDIIQKERLWEVMQ